MAKVPFSKLQSSVNNQDAKVVFYNKAGEEVVYEVKYYLPIKDKLELVSRIINNSIDDNGYYNPMRVKLFMTLETVYAYTNLTFTDKMKEDPYKLYDLLVSNDIFNQVILNMCPEDWATIQEDVWATIKSIYEYNNSVMGILDSVKSDYSGLNLDASEIQKNLSDPENMELLKSILDKLG